MAGGDGNGWVQCDCGHRHWGRHGAAGLALVRPGVRPRVLLQLRAAWTHEGGTWGLVGGARDSHETVAEAALREAVEEAEVEPDLITVARELVGTDHGNWTYTYVIGLADARLTATDATPESDALEWVDLDEVAGRALHPAFGGSWTPLLAAIREVLLVRSGQ
ncbi:NUDIX hydrolase [Kineosporia rhizophila]|uniref:NUDIX domain-containing protein n=1 Tax=Kineosporia TaxID=49184 RepID=UPI001E2F4503|nr:MULTISPECIES: NUDIX hydrolase [Kineosporia]MCE0537304.1 NUDIX hydrolase [Kineosporia rhizophila]GLY17552.1 putative mutator protein MutT3 [Kineosporia sp. NBRC 101677]